MFRRTSAVSVSLLQAFLLLAPAASALGSPDATVTIPVGEVLDTMGVPLRSAGDLVIEGLVMGPAGVALVLEAAGDIVVRGSVLADHGLEGRDGGSVRLVAGGAVIVLEGARVAAGAGGHGAPSIRPGGRAEGDDGGDGGGVVVLARAVDLQGVVAPGLGGDGGFAFGLLAFGGDGGAMGELLVNGERGTTGEFSANPVLPVRGPDVAPSRLMHACSDPAVGVSGAPFSGANGGNACSHGADGNPGSTGDTGHKDDCPFFNNCCTAGGPGADGGFGGSGVAVGGAGGSSATSGMPAGHGGAAVAEGGNGGSGGKGGTGGHAGWWGKGCTGGNGGNGGKGGDAAATGGVQGLHFLDCTLNGHSGTATADAGAGGDMGGGGDGGGSDLGATGDQGQPGGKGGDGNGVPLVPPELPCLGPGAPSLMAVADPTLPQITLTILAPQNTGSNPILWYKVYRTDDSSQQPSYVYDVSYTGVFQTHLDPGLIPGRTYYYQVVAHSAGGDSGKSNTAQAKVFRLTLGDSPILAAAFTGAGKATLTITAPPNPGGTLVYYEIYRGTVANGQKSYVGPASPSQTSLPTTYDDTGLSAPATYCYIVSAAYQGGGFSPDSNEACAFVAFKKSVTVVDAYPATDAGQVEIAIASGGGSDDGTMAGSNVSHYRLFRSTPDERMEEVALVPASNGMPVVTYRDGGLAPGEVYTYGVIPVAHDGVQGDPSRPATTLSGPAESRELPISPDIDPDDLLGPGEPGEAGPKLRVGAWKR